MSPLKFNTRSHLDRIYGSLARRVHPDLDALSQRTTGLTLLLALILEDLSEFQLLFLAYMATE